jgi:transcriptional regulator with XRE-family HTH domain
MADENAVLDARADALVEDHANLLTALVKLRKKHHLSQRVVAERMGVKQPTVAAFERYDANPRLSTIRRYALAVDALIDTTVTDDCVDPNNGFVAIVDSIRWGTREDVFENGSWSFRDANSLNHAQG